MYFSWPASLVGTTPQVAKGRAYGYTIPSIHSRHSSSNASPRPSIRALKPQKLQAQ